MGASQAQQMLQQLQQQMQNPNFGSNYMSQLQNAGLGQQNPSNFFGTPFDEQFLRQSVMNRVLGYYGMSGGAQGQYGGVGNPSAILNQKTPTDPMTGGIKSFSPPWQQGGWDSKMNWKQAGKPPILAPGGNDLSGGGGFPRRDQMGIMPYNGGGGDPAMQGGPQGGPDMQLGFNDSGMDNPMGGGQGGFNPMGNGGGYGQDMIAGGMNMGQSYLDQFTNNNEMDSLFNRIQNQSGVGLNNSYGGNVQSSFGGGGGGGMSPDLQSMLSQLGGQRFGGGIAAGLPPQAENWINQNTNSQMDAMNLDYGKEKQNLVNQMFGRGMNASSAASDSAGKLLYGRSAAMNQIQGQGSQQKLDLYKQILAQEAAKGNQQGGSAGGGIHVLNPNASMDASVNNMRSQLESSGLPISFDQKMQLAQLQLQGAGMNQQGQLGNRGLDIQQLLGLGQQGLQGQGLSQDFMSQLLGMGLQRQQGAAGMNQSDLARMQQYLMGQSSQFANIGQQNAQIEAQKQSFWKQLLMAGVGGASSLLGGMASGGTGFFR